MSSHEFSMTPTSSNAEHNCGIIALAAFSEANGPTYNMVLYAFGVANFFSTLTVPNASVADSDPDDSPGKDSIPSALNNRMTFLCHPAVSGQGRQR